MKLAFVFAALFVAAPAAAEDCAQIAEPLAYNACLARLGPAARAVPVGPAPIVRARTPARRAHGRRARAEMVFSVRK